MQFPINAAAFNISSVEVYQDKLVYLINNTVTFVYPKLMPAIEDQFPFSAHDYYMVLNLHLGGSWVGAVEPSHLPVEMAVDWIRVYQKK